MAKTVLVCGATGQVGGEAARVLLRDFPDGITVKCLVRDAASAKAVALAEAGATLCVGNYDNRASLDSALEGASAVFLACSNVPEQIALESNLIAAAEESASCSYLVKLSTCGPEGYCELDSVIEYGRFHAAIEKTLSESSLRWTSLQPNYFMQNHAADIFATLPQKIVCYPHSEATCSVVDTRDVAAVAAKLLALPEDAVNDHSGKKYHVCGPAPLSVNDMAAIYSKELGVDVSVVQVDFAAYQQALEGAGFPTWLATAITHNHTDFWAMGKLDHPSSPEVVALHPIFRTFEQWAAEMAPLVKLAPSE